MDSSQWSVLLRGAEREVVGGALVVCRWRGVVGGVVVRGVVVTCSGARVRDAALVDWLVVPGGVAVVTPSNVTIGWSSTT